jgi:hypothetical protein
MLIFCGIVTAILKMETGRNFSMSGINSGHHNLPTYEISLKSNNVEFVQYCGTHFENGDQWKIFNVRPSLSTHQGLGRPCAIGAFKSIVARYLCAQ